MWRCSGEGPIISFDQRLVIHHTIARHMGIGVPEAAEPDGNLRTVARIIGR
jgi:hypothetical protein